MIRLPSGFLAAPQQEQAKTVDVNIVKDIAVKKEIEDIVIESKSINDKIQHS
jgi:hypothetical protein